MKRYERTGFIHPAGVVATACTHRTTDATREAPYGGRARDQLTAREGQVGPFGVTERLVVPRKSGNADGGKKPQLKTNVTSDKE
jgi:hypothetical protein